MILLNLRFGIFLSLGCLGLGGFFLHQAFENSGQDVFVVVIVAPVLCALGLVLVWTTISQFRSFREWDRYRRQKAEQVSATQGMFSKY